MVLSAWIFGSIATNYGTISPSTKSEMPCGRESCQLAWGCNPQHAHDGASSFLLLHGLQISPNYFRITLNIFWRPSAISRHDP
jgi:hypothetical protein